MIKIFCLLILSILFSCGKPVTKDLLIDSPKPSCHSPIDINNFTILSGINDLKSEDKLNLKEYNSNTPINDYYLPEPDSYLYLEQDLEENPNCNFLDQNILDREDSLKLEDDCIVN